MSFCFVFYNSYLTSNNFMASDGYFLPFSDKTIKICKFFDDVGIFLKIDFSGNFVQFLSSEFDGFRKYGCLRLEMCWTTS